MNYVIWSFLVILLKVTGLSEFDWITFLVEFPLQPSLILSSLNLNAHRWGVVDSSPAQFRWICDARRWKRITLFSRDDGCSTVFGIHPERDGTAGPRGRPILCHQQSGRVQSKFTSTYRNPQEKKKKCRPILIIILCIVRFIQIISLSGYLY
jgi:hypothetical protein